jgi:oligopeptide transport system substrate-binding protein
VRLLAEAGYTFNQPLTLSVAIPHGREHADLLAAISNSWGVIGVRVKAYARGTLSHRRAIEKGDFDLAAVERIARAPVADTFLQPFTCAVRLGGYCNPAVDQLLADAAAEDDPGTRIQLQRRANRLISEDAPLIAVLSPIRWSLVSRRVTGWENNVAGAHPLSGLAMTGTKEE